MSFLISPGVQVQEKDFTNIIPAVSTSLGAYVGEFNWGPIGIFTTISSEKELATLYGKPTAPFAKSFLTAASFLKYGNNIKITRAVSPFTTPSTATLNAFAGKTVTLNGITFSGASGSTSLTSSGTITGLITTGQVVGGSAGIPISATVSSASGTTVTLSTALTQTVSAGTVLQFQTQPTVVQYQIGNIDTFNSATFSDANLSLIARYPGAVGNSVIAYIVTKNSVAATDTTGASSLFDYIPTTNDEIHILIVDEDGGLTGVAGTILEKWTGLSLFTDAKKSDGTNNYYKTVLNNSSNYIWAIKLSGVFGSGADASSTSGNTLTVPYGPTSLLFQFAGAQDGTGSLDTSSALDLISDAETVDVNLLFCSDVGESSLSTTEQRLQSIASTRKDCLAFISAPITAVVNQTIETIKVTSVTTKFSAATHDSYSVFDSTPLYVYNKYQDSYIWIPACGHNAGLCANVDSVADTWFSPAGYTRGNLKDVVKLGLNPGQTSRDTLYKLSINPIVQFPGQGTLLYGDKTAQSKPSAFDRINVRRLFILLEKAIAIAAKYQLFELNDSFTQAMFRNMTEPYLRDIKGRRGVKDFLVVCDDSNNTGQVVDSNQFVADIYVKPARSINFITLNFIATRTGVSFSEIAGASSSGQ